MLPRALQQRKGQKKLPRTGLLAMQIHALASNNEPALSVALTSCSTAECGVRLALTALAACLLSRATTQWQARSASTIPGECS